MKWRRTLLKQKKRLNNRVLPNSFLLSSYSCSLRPKLDNSSWTCSAVEKSRSPSQRKKALFKSKRYTRLKSQTIVRKAQSQSQGCITSQLTMNMITYNSALKCLRMESVLGSFTILRRSKILSNLKLTFSNEDCLIFLSQDETLLLWQYKKKKSQIEISKITQFIYGAQSSTFTQYKEDIFKII